MSRIDFIKLSKEAQAEVRRRAVDSYLSMGRKNKSKIAKMYHVTPNIIKKWLDNYAATGAKSFAADKRGAKAFQNSSLNKRQQNWLKKQLMNKTPEQLNFPFVLWTRGLVCELIERKFGIKVDVSTAGNYLKDFGMRPLRSRF